MADASLEEAFSAVVDSVATALTPLGFKRRGRAMRIVAGTNCGIVDFQRSMGSSWTSIRFTINTGVVCGELLEWQRGKKKNANVTDAHVSQRIGGLMPGRPDKWWEINQMTDVTGLKCEVTEAVVHLAAPYVQRYLDTDAIIALWESGESHGLTEMQRSELLPVLKAKRQGAAN